MPTAASPSRSTRRPACATTCASSSCRRRSTARGWRVCSVDAPVIEAKGRSFPVTTRYLGRDPLRRIEDQVVDAAMTAVRAEPGSILAFLPGQAEIRRVAERLGERITDAAIEIAPLLWRHGPPRPGPRGEARAEGPPQDRARHFDRRKLDHHRGRARRHRLRPRPRAALRCRRRHHATGDGADLARQRRPAPGPRRTHRAGRVLSPVGRAADAGAAGLRRTGNPQRRSRQPAARLRRLG